MYDKMESVKKACIMLIGVLICTLLFGTYCIKAAIISYYVSGTSYEHADNTGFNSLGSSKDTLCFGKKSIGLFTVQGDIKKTTTYDGYAAYGATNEIELSYLYDGSCQTKDKDAWNLAASDGKKVDGVELDKKVNLGAIVVQSSTNGTDWNTVFTATDVFEKKESINSFYKIPLEDVKSGTYYRVTVAYRMKQKVAEETTLFIKSDVIEYKEFTEVYKFYVGYSGNGVEIRNIATGNEAGIAVEKGFVVDKCGINCNITASKNGGSNTALDSLTSVTEPGKYKIKVTNNLGQLYEVEIEVTKGSDLKQILPRVYEGGEKGKYEITDTSVGYPSFGIPSITKLKIGCQDNSKITISEKNGYTAYGITGDSVALYLNLSEISKLEKEGWEIFSDEYGKKEKEKIAGVQTGEVATGALIIQKSKNGTDWENVDQGRYANGLYTTDFYTYYGEKGDTYIYSPDGVELLNGLYIRVVYAYELKAIDEKTYNRCLEVYEFYLCSSELGAVTFHNLTATDEKIKEAIGEDNYDSLELYKNAETLVSGSGTVTGFSVDTSKNPTVTYTIKRNGQDIAVLSNHRYTTDGKYDISLKSAVGDTETVTIYVDKSDSTEALERYFGTGFLSGKRIYEEGNYPVFEGGKVSYVVSKIAKEYLHISGTIVNTTTGEEIIIDSTRDGVTEMILAPGDYVATFSTMQMDGEEVLPGDWRVFTFCFRIIPEGSAPGPVVNMRKLAEYAKSSMTDSYPMYYGLTYSSAKGGNITLAFASREAAKQYAYNYEKGTVEEQSDGTYRYTGSFVMTQKSKYVSAWDLADAMDKFADQAVQVLYFDMSDPFTYLTLNSTFANVKNPRTLELNNSIVLFADGEKEELCEKVEALPIISRKPCRYLSPGEFGSVSADYVDFMFVKDKYGVDSEKVVITDCDGKEYQIQYQIGVGLQLMQQNCPSGIVTITETTCYGDVNTYEAVYIAENDNTATIELTCYEGKEENKASFSKADNGNAVEVSAFKIEKIVDELDPYSIVVVENAENSEDTVCYVADQDMPRIWTEPGTYKVSVVNRLGYTYSITVNIYESEYTVIAFAGSETEDVESIFTMVGERNVELPKLTRYGYELVGFESEEGKVYTDEIANITFKGEETLTAIWKAKEYTITLRDAEGKVYKKMAVEFGENYELETLELSGDTEFVGWLMNDELIQDNRITISEEGNIVLTASVTVPIDKTVPVVDKEELEGQKDNNQKGNWWIVLVVALIIIVFALIVLILKKKAVSIKNIFKSGSKGEIEHEKKN